MCNSGFFGFLGGWGGKGAWDGGWGKEGRRRGLDYFECNGRTIMCKVTHTKSQICTSLEVVATLDYQGSFSETDKRQ